MALAYSSAEAAPATKQSLVPVFKSPADVQTACYWYWINGNVSKEGVAKDVKAMKKAGINRAFIGFQGLDDLPIGPVRIQSDEWYEVLRSALATAAEEGVEIGIFNCPGWSQSGGPWVSPDQSMRYLGQQTFHVKGGAPVNIAMKAPENLLETVNVLAFRTPQGVTVSNKNAKITADGMVNVAAMFDGDASTSANASGDKASFTVIPEKKDFTLRSMIVKPSTIIKAAFTVYAKIDGQYKEIARFDGDRTNMMIEVGYDKLAPLAYSIDNVKADEYRIDMTVNPGCGFAEVVLSENPVVDRYADQILSKMHQTPQPYWNDYKWTVPVDYEAGVVVSPADVIDVTSSLKGEKFSWNAPEGDWTIVRNYMAPTGIHNDPTLPYDGRGPEVDRWNQEKLKHHYDSFVGDILRKIPAADRRTWNTIVSDSYERATQNFGDDFVEYFRQHYGYDPTPYLLTYTGQVVGSADQSSRFLWDLRRMIADRLSYDHIGGLKKLANADGLKVWLESYGHWGYPGEFLQYGGQSDEVGGEFWSEGSLGEIENRAASSVAHTYGKDRTWSESFTCGGLEYTRSPRSMKQNGDKYFTEGINATLLHLVVSQVGEKDLPGFNAWFGNEFNRRNTWYEQFDLFTDYLKRANYMLQQGNYVADIAYYIGEDCPVMIGITDPAVPEGYQFDYINSEVIEKNLKADASHKLSLPHGTSYKLLVLPPSDAMRPAVARKIKALLEDGAVVLGPRPTHSPSLQDYPVADQQVRQIADELWGNMGQRGVRNVGKGLLFTGYTVDEVFDALNVNPDFRAMGLPAQTVRYAHTTQPGLDIYFVANQTEAPVEFEGRFRVKGKRPEFWRATDGDIRPVASYVPAGEFTSIPMKLDANESVFVVFADADNAASHDYDMALNYPAQTTLVSFDTPWKIDLVSMFGEKKTLKNASLTDLSKNDDRFVKYFSGRAVYNNVFNLAEVPAGKLTLDLGKVAEMAKVKINGKYAGGVWTAPYTIAVDPSLLRKGKNNIEIEVVSNWHNRIIGDINLPEDQRKVVTVVQTYAPDAPLQPTGLMGPVVLTTDK